MNNRIVKPLLFLSPALLIYLFVMVYPMFNSLYLSFFETSGVSGGEDLIFVGLGNYKALMYDDIFWISLRNNILWMIWALIIPMSIGLLLAVILNSPFKGKVIYRGIFYYPSILSFIAVGLIWGWLYSPSFGLINQLLNNIGLPSLTRNWLGDAKTALFASYLAHAWQATGFSMVLFLGGLQTISLDVYESAKVEGANKLQTFWKITLPLLRQTYIVIIAMTMIGSMKVFDTIFTMTGGGPCATIYSSCPVLVFQCV